jgi:hypothetical protein
MKRGHVKMKKLGGTGARGRANTRSLSVPAAIAVKIPDGAIFAPELTPEGLLYRPVYVPEPENGEGPEWLKGTGDVADTF